MKIPALLCGKNAMEEAIIEAPKSKQSTEPLENYTEEQWDIEISPKSSLFDFHLKELWRYRDLLVMFIKRDIVTTYKQTVLGPLWFVIQPILTTLTYIVIFGKIAGISTDGVPPLLFYLSGITLWNYFSGTFTATSNTFKENENIFGKVYFPRLIVPISKVVSGLIKFGIQLVLLVGVYVYYLINSEAIAPSYVLLYFPAFILVMSGLGLGAGIIFSALTTKYRDFTFLITFGIQLLMYATPVIYPVSIIPEKYKAFILANPITPIMEGFRTALFGVGSFDSMHLLYAACCTLFLLFFGILIFNRTEKTFMDTV